MEEKMNPRHKELEEKISELEESLGQLKQQLQSEDEAEQHKAIDNLEEYFNEVDNRFSNLRDFWDIVAGELSSLFHGQKENNNK